MDTAVDQGGMSRYWASQTGPSRTAAAPTSFAWRQPQPGLTSGLPPAEGLLATFDTILKNMVSAPAPSTAPAPPAAEPSSEVHPSSTPSSSRSESEEENEATKESPPQATADAASQDDSTSRTQEAPAEEAIAAETAREKPIAVVDQEVPEETVGVVAEKVSEDHAATTPDDPEEQLRPSAANFSEPDQSSRGEPLEQLAKPLVESASIEAEPRSQRWTDRERAEIPKPEENALAAPDPSLAASLVQQQQQPAPNTETLPQAENSDSALAQLQAQNPQRLGLEPSVTGGMRRIAGRDSHEETSSTAPREAPLDATETSSLVAPANQSEQQSRSIAEEDSRQGTGQEGPRLESWSGQEPSEGKVQRRRRSDRGGERGAEDRGAARREGSSPLDHLLRGMEPVAPHPLTSDMHRVQVAPAESLTPSASAPQGAIPPFPSVLQSAASPTPISSASSSVVGSAPLLSTAAVEPGGAAPVSFGEAAGPAATRENSTTAPSPTQAPQSSDNGDRVRLIQRVARAFQKLGNDGGQIHMMLHPAHLGSVRLDLSVHGKTLEATLSTQTEEALETLREHLGGLRERLQEFGMEVERLELRLAQSESSSAGHTATSDQRQSLWQEMGQQGDSQRRGERKAPDAAKTAISPRIGAARGIASSLNPASKRLDLML